MAVDTKEQCALAELVDRYVCGEETPDSVEELRTIRSTLLLYAYGFPKARMHEVLWRSRETVEVYLRVLQLRLGDTASAREFLELTENQQPHTDAPEGSGESMDDKALRALDVLEYWTSRWLDDSMEPK